MLEISVDGVGQAAYLKMNGFNVIARTGQRTYKFAVPADQVDAFAMLRRDWINSAYASFDNELVLLRRMDITA